MYYLLSPKVIKTNPLCLVRNEVVNDRSESTVDVSLGKIFYFILYNENKLSMLIQVFIHSEW